MHVAIRDYMKRGIAGSLIFTVFDRNPLTALAKDVQDVYYYYAKAGDLRDPEAYVKEIAIAMVDRNGSPVGLERRPPMYDDQVLPFDITITAMNEYGNTAQQRIYGVEILNSGEGVSVDDIVNERQVTFVARTLTSWIPKRFIPENSQAALQWDRSKGALAQPSKQMEGVMDSQYREELVTAEAGVLSSSPTP